MRPIWRRAFALAALAVCPMGCTRHYYYGQVPTMPLCDPPVTSQPTVISRSGDVCAVPGTIVGPERGSQISLSQPQGARTSTGTASASRSQSSSYWRRPDPESMASTRIEGSLPDDATIR
jgi:hypothetical protein